MMKEPFPKSPIHRWDLSPSVAIELQNQLRQRVRHTPLDLASLQTVAGVDVGFPRGKEIARAAIAVLDIETLDIIDQAMAEIPVPFPYVPGLLSFREMPVILAASKKLHTHPDLWMVDGHGLAHPRRFGLACHLGLWLDQPALGCGKSILTGTHARLGEERGEWQPLMVENEVVGAALRTRTRVKPVYISVGHRIDLHTAIAITMACGKGYRLPEPTRLAHRLASGK